MGFKSTVLRPWANQVSRQIGKWSSNALKEQEEVLTQLIEKGKQTQFGQDHDFSNIYTYDDYKKHVPVRDYEGLKPYIDRIVAGESAILWLMRD